MSNEEDDLDRRVLQIIYSDLELLELSISDLAIALGGKLSPLDKSYFNRLKSGKLSGCFNRTVRNERNYKYYQLFKGLDLQVDSFVRIIRLHFDRGVAFLSKCGTTALSIKLFCLCYVDVVVDLYEGVLKQVLTFSLHDCVYLYKFFIKFDNSLLSYRIKHVYVRDEIYDLILNSLWFALKDAWWLYLDTSVLRSLFPFISHMKVEGNYQPTIHDLNHVLHNIHFVTLISQDISFQSETQTIIDSTSNDDDFNSFNERFESGNGMYKNMKESDLDIKYVRSIQTCGLNEDKNGNTEFEDNISMNSENEHGVSENEDYKGVNEFGKQLRELERTLDSLDLIGEVNWSQVIYIALVGFIYIVLFESYLNVVLNNLKVQMESKQYVEFLVKRLQDLIQAYGLMVEVDVNYTAWAHDKLGPLSDKQLLECFNTYSDSLFFEEGYRENQLFSYRGESMSGDKRCKLGIGGGESMYLLAPALERLQRTQYHVVLRIASECATPVLRLIEEIYIVSESKLYYDILYNADECLIGPKGPLSASCRMLPVTFKRAVFVETYFIIVKKYVTKVRESGSEVCEAIFFDSMSIWDSVIDFFDFAVNPETMEEECVKLVASILEQIKFTPNVDMSGLDEYKRSFRVNFFDAPKNSGSMLSQYTYSCLYQAGFISAPDTSCSNRHSSIRAQASDNRNGSTMVFSSESNRTVGYAGVSGNVHDRTSVGNYSSDFINAGSRVFNLATGSAGSNSDGADYGSSTNTGNRASRSTTAGNPNDATNTSTTFGASIANAHYRANGQVAMAYSSQANYALHATSGGPTAPTTPNPNMTGRNAGCEFGGATPVAACGSDDGTAAGRGNYLDKYVVWLDGSRRKNMLIFGNLILFFRENSLLQPAGFITFNSIYSVLSPNSLAQVHPSVQILENNSENDSFSCGTSRSSESPPSSEGKERLSPPKNVPTISSSRSKNTDAPGTKVTSALLEEVNVSATEDLTFVEKNNDNTYNNKDQFTTKCSNSPENANSPLGVNNDRVMHLRSFSKNQMASVTTIDHYPGSDNSLSKLLRGGNNASMTRHGSCSSRFSTFENMEVWGWQIRLELFDSCILNNMNLFNVDIEFTSPESRKYWEQQIRYKAKAKAQFVSWPYHSFFFDSV